MSRTIYIAGSSQEIPRARRCMEAVRERGWVVTVDWTVVIEEVGNPNSGSLGECRTWAREDLAGVEAASVFWLLYPVRLSHGAFFEYGAAWRAGKMTIVSGAGHAGSIFSALADGLADTDEDALRYLAAMPRRAYG